MLPNGRYHIGYCPCTVGERLIVTGVVCMSKEVKVGIVDSYRLISLLLRVAAKVSGTSYKYHYHLGVNKREVKLIRLRYDMYEGNVYRKVTKEQTFYTVGFVIKEPLLRKMMSNSISEVAIHSLK